MTGIQHIPTVYATASLHWHLWSKIMARSLPLFARKAKKDDPDTKLEPESAVKKDDESGSDEEGPNRKIDESEEVQVRDIKYNLENLGLDDI